MIPDITKFGAIDHIIISIVYLTPDFDVLIKKHIINYKQNTVDNHKADCPYLEGQGDQKKSFYRYHITRQKN